MNHTFPLCCAKVSLVTEQFTLSSACLRREVPVSIILPSDYKRVDQTYPLIIFQDGQDFPALALAETAERLITEGVIKPVILAGIFAGERRVHEYGVASKADYMGRGDLAGAYTSFVVDELLPRLHARYPISGPRHSIAGFSLGGLMALDIAWNHSDRFEKAGIFSGSLWWREKAFGSGYDDSDRIMHQQVKTTTLKPDLKCWFQTGTHDETCDRNHDGVIDSISDTLDCIAEMERKGFRWNQDVFYHEVGGGEHNPATWSRVMPEFLKWVAIRERYHDSPFTNPRF